MRYRRKPVEVEAFRWTDEGELPGWAFEAFHDGVLESIEDKDSTFLAVRTKLGVFYAKYGDWILRELDGSITPMSDESFRKTYDEVVP